MLYADRNEQYIYHFSKLVYKKLVEYKNSIVFYRYLMSSAKR